MTTAAATQPLTLGQRVQAVRRGRRLTQRDIATRTGLAEPFLSRIENNRAEPSLKTLERLAEAMGVTLGDFLTLDAGRFKSSCPVSQSGRCIAELIYQPGRRAPVMNERYTPRQVRLLRLATYLVQSGAPETLAALETVMHAMTKGLGSRRAPRRPGSLDVETAAPAE